MANLYQIPMEAEQALDLYFSSFDENGEQTESDEVVAQRYAAVEALQNQQNDAAEWILKTRANAVYEIEALQIESARLLERCAKSEKTVERMDNLISRYFPSETTQKPVVIANWTVKYTKSSAVEITDLEKIPKKYFHPDKVVTTPGGPDKKAIKEAIEQATENGEKFEGARIEERRTLKIS